MAFMRDTIEPGHRIRTALIAWAAGWWSAFDLAAFDCRERQSKNLPIAASISAIANGWPLVLVERLGVDEELVAQHGLELAGVHLGHEHLVEAREQRAEVLRQRPDVADVDVADVEALARARRTAWWIGPKVEPQPTTASLPLASPSATSCSGIVARCRRSWPCGRRSSPGGWRANSRCCRCRRPSRCRRCGASGPGVPGLIHGRAPLSSRL